MLSAVEELLRSRVPETSSAVFYALLNYMYLKRQPPDAYLAYVRHAMTGNAELIPYFAAAELGRRLGASVIPELVDFARVHEHQHVSAAWDPFLVLCPDERPEAEPVRPAASGRVTPRRRAASAVSKNSRGTSARTAVARRAVPKQAQHDWTPETLGERRSAVVHALRRARGARLVNAQLAALYALGRFLPDSPEARRVLLEALGDPGLREAAVAVLLDTDSGILRTAANRLEKAFKERDAVGFFCTDPWGGGTP